MSKNVTSNSSGVVKINILQDELKARNVKADNAFIEVVWPDLKEKLKSKIKGKKMLTYDDLTAAAEKLYAKLTPKEQKVVDMFHHLRAQAKLYHSQGTGAGAFASFDEIVRSYYDDVAKLEKRMDELFKKMNMKGTMPHAMDTPNLGIINLEHGGENAIARRKRNEIWKAVKSNVADDSAKAIIDDIIKSTSDSDRSKHYEKLLKALDGKYTKVPYLLSNSIKDGWKPMGGNEFVAMFESMLDVMDDIILKMNGYDLHRVLLDQRVTYEFKKNEVALAIRTSNNGEGVNQYSDSNGTAAQHTVDADNKRINRPTLYTFIKTFLKPSSGLFPVIEVDKVFWRGVMGSAKARVDFTTVSNKNTHTMRNERYIGFSMYIESSLDNLQKVTSHSAGFGRNDIFLLSGANKDYISIVSDRFFNDLEVVAPKNVIDKARELDAQKVNKVIRDVLSDSRRSRRELTKVLALMHTHEDFKALELMMQGALLYEDYVAKVQLAYSDYSLRSAVSMSGKTSDQSTWIKLDMSSLVQKKLKDPKIRAEFLAGKWLDAGTKKSDRVPNLRRLMRVNDDGTISISRELLLNTRTNDNAKKASGPTKTSMLGNSFGKMFAVLKITNADIMNISMKFPDGLPINLFFNIVRDTKLEGNPFAFNLTENPALNVGKSVQYQGAIQGDGFVSGNTRFTGTRKTAPITKIIYGKNITSLPYWMVFGLRSANGIFHGQTGGAGSGVFIGNDPKYYSPEVIGWNEKISSSNDLPRVYATDFIEMFKKIVRSGGGLAMYQIGSLDNLFVIGGAVMDIGGLNINILQHALSESGNLSPGDRLQLKKLTLAFNDADSGFDREKRKTIASSIVGLVESDTEYRGLIHRWLNGLAQTSDQFTKKTYFVPLNHPMYLYFQRKYDGFSYMLSIVGRATLGKVVMSGLEAHKGYAHVMGILQKAIKFLEQINYDLNRGRMMPKGKGSKGKDKGWNAYVADHPGTFAPMSSHEETAKKALERMSRYLDILPSDLINKIQNAGLIEWQKVKGSKDGRMRLVFTKSSLNSKSPGLAALEILIGFMNEIQLSYSGKLRDIGKSIDLVSAERGIPNRGSQLSLEVLYKQKNYLLTIGAIEQIFKYVPGMPGNYIDVIKSKQPYTMIAKSLKGSSPILLLIAPLLAASGSGQAETDYQEHMLDTLADSFLDRNGNIDTAKIESLTDADLTDDEISMKECLLIYNKDTNGTFLEWAKDANDQKKLHTYLSNVFHNAFGAGTDEHFGMYGDPLMQSVAGPVLQEINKWMDIYLGFNLVDLGLFALLLMFGAMLAVLFVWLWSISVLIIVLIIVLLIGDISDGEWDGIMTLIGYLSYFDAPFLALNYLLSDQGCDSDRDFYRKVKGPFAVTQTFALGYKLEYNILTGPLLQGGNLTKDQVLEAKAAYELRTGNKVTDEELQQALEFQQGIELGGY